MKKCSGDQSGLKNGSQRAPVQVELVFVRIQHVGVGVRVEVPDDFGQRIRRQLVVVIEQRDEVARGGRQRRVRRRARCRR